MNERGISGASSALMDKDRISSEEYTGIFADYEGQRGVLGELYGERSRKLVEGASSAEDIRGSTAEVTEYIEGLATELSLRYSDEGKSREEIAQLIDQFIATETQALLGSMTDKRTDMAVRHNRFMPEFMKSWYDKAVVTWRSWEVPKGDGSLVTRMRETGTWQHLEQKFENQTTVRAKLGRFALVAATSAVNGAENLVRYSGARKRFMAMAGVGLAVGATSGLALGAAGAGVAGAAVGGVMARASIRTGITNKLDNDAYAAEYAIHDQEQMQSKLDSMRLDEEGYDVEQLLGYVDSETEKMIYKNNVKLMSGVAIGLAAGLVGNTASKGIGWFSRQWFDASFVTPAHATPMRVDVDGSGTGSGDIDKVIDARADKDITAVIDEKRTDVAKVVGDGERVDITNVIDEKRTDIVATIADKDRVDITAIVDEESSVDITNIESAEAKVDRGVFMVENGHGLIRENIEWAKDSGYDVPDSVMEKLHYAEVKEFGAKGIIDLKNYERDIYMHGNDVRINAPGEAVWRDKVVDFKVKWLADHGYYPDGTVVDVDSTHVDIETAESSDSGVVDAESETDKSSDTTVVEDEPVFSAEDWTKIEGLLEKAADRDMLGDLAVYDQTLMDGIGPRLETINYPDGSPVVSYSGGHWTFNDSVYSLPEDALSRIHGYLDEHDAVAERVQRLTRML